MNVLGVKITNHDTGACCISNNKISAISEERLNRVKHSPNYFPHLSIKYCLQECGISCGEIDLVVIDQTGSRDELDMKKMFLENTSNDFLKARIEVINHHDAHVANAFFASPFNDSAVLVCDGAGEKIKSYNGYSLTETETLYRGWENKVYEISKTAHLREGKIFPSTFGIGKLYSYISNNYLGFGPYNEGKMMGLAPYGSVLSDEKKILNSFEEHLWYKDVGGHIICNSRIIFPSNLIKKRINYWRTLPSYISRALLKLKILLSNQIINLVGGNRAVDINLFPKVILPKPSRSQSDQLPDEYYSSIAYAIQTILEKVTILWAKKLKNITQSENLCVSGGVGLNIDANYKYYSEAGYKNVFIQPAASDCGIPLGCALYGYHVIADMPRFFEMKSASMGRKYSNEEIESALKLFSDKIKFEVSDNIYSDTAKYIANGNIIGWFSGGSEYGPRALGNRSILCDARRKDMKDVLNNRVKHRESWRPFATSILEEHVTEYFELTYPSPFMLLAAKVKKDKLGSIPSVTHIDGTSRIQTVSAESNPAYYKLIKEFHNLTGTPLILNTSFNLGGDPIVESPKDAIDTFTRTNMDYLVIENYIITKK